MEWDNLPSEYKLRILEKHVTLDEAKELVKRLKANTRVPKPSPNVFSCPRCNHKYTEMWSTRHEPVQWRKQCNYCGFTGYPTSSKWTVKKEWNRAVIDQLNDNYQTPEYRDDWYKL